MTPAFRRRARHALAYGGLALVVLFAVAARLRPPPSLSIGDITPARAFSRVRLEGVVERDAIWLSDGALQFTLNDGTGSLAIFVERPEIGSAPRRGARARVEGHLFVGVGADRRLRVVEGENLQLLDDAALGQASRWLGKKEGARVSLSGTVARVWLPPPGSRAPARVRLATEEGVVEVVHWLEQPPELAEGDVVQVRGKIDVYRGESRIKVFSKKDLRVTRSGAST